MVNLEINKENLIHNINKIKDIANESKKSPKIIAVIKGNGYGLGLELYGKLLLENDIDFFAVSTYEEAVKLRNSGFENDILLLSSICVEQEVRGLIEKDIILTLGSKIACETCEKVANEMKKKPRAHIKIDTGFGRYGFLYNQLEEILESFKILKNTKITGVFSHFSMSFHKKSNWTNIQFDRFMNCINILKEENIQLGMVHICNSCAFLTYPNMYLDAVRIGSAFTGRISIENTYGLKKIGFLTSAVSEIKELPKGYNISYTNGYKTKKNTKVAIIPTGTYAGFNMSKSKTLFRTIDKFRYLYSDLKLFLFNKKIQVVICEKKHNIIGTIGMYHLIVDITGSNIQIGDKVMLEVNPIFVDSSVDRKYI